MSAIESSPVRDGNPLALLLATLSFGVCFFAWALLGPLGPDLQEQLALSDTELAITIAIPVLLGSLLRIPMGVLTERYGGRIVFTVLMSFMVLPLIGLALFNGSWPAVLVCGFLLGFAGASFAIGVPFVSSWYPASRQGFILGIYGVGMGGTVVAALTAARIAKATNIAAVFWVAAVLVAIMALLFWSLARDAPGSVKGKTGSMFAGLTLLKGNPRAWALTLFYFVSFGGFVAMFLYLPKLLVGVHELTKTDAGSRAAGFALLAVVARPLGGWLADRFGAGKVLTLSFVGTGLMAVLLAGAYREMVPLTIACLTMAVFLGLGIGAVFKLVPEWFPENIGAVTGVVGAAGGLGGFFPPLVMAIVKSATGSYALGFVLMALTAALSLLVLRLIGAAPGGKVPAADTAT